MPKSSTVVSIVDTSGDNRPPTFVVGKLTCHRL